MKGKSKKDSRDVEIPCVECGCMLKFGIENDVVVESNGIVACNIPGVVCPDCIDSLLEKVADPPGLVCIKDLSSILARELPMSLTFLLPPSEASKFFASLFPNYELGEEPKGEIL